MNIIKFIIALGVLTGFVVVIGFGVYVAYEYLFSQWEILNREWRAVLVLILAVLTFCTFYITYSFRNSLRKYGPRNTGKVMAYNEFVQWYSLLKSNGEEVVNLNMLKKIANQLLLWGNQQVVKQVYELTNKAQDSAADREQIIDSAEHVYEELRRDLGVNSEMDKSVFL